MMEVVEVGGGVGEMGWVHKLSSLASQYHGDAVLFSTDPSVSTDMTHPTSYENDAAGLTGAALDAVMNNVGSRITTAAVAPSANPWCPGGCRALA